MSNNEGVCGLSYLTQASEAHEYLTMPVGYSVVHLGGRLLWISF